MSNKLIFLAVCYLWSWPTGLGQRIAGKGKGPKQQLCFTIIGDIGGLPKPPFTTWMQRKVADEMEKVMSKKDCRFIIALGDNFYYTGVQSVDDPRFKQTFENTYKKTFHYVPWYFVAGNHDHISNVSAQIAYSKVSSRWKFPHYFHSKVHAIPNTSKTVHVILIDTTLLADVCANYKKRNSPLANGQLKWIEDELKSSSSEYIIVGGHHPVLSAGSHGSHPCLLSKLKPLLEKYSVTAYFSGHDHNLQHIDDPESNVAYFVSGSGNFYNGWNLNRKKLPKGALKHFHKKNGFIIACARARKMRVIFVDGRNGKTLYKIKLFPRPELSLKKNARQSTKLVLDELNEFDRF